MRQGVKMRDSTCHWDDVVRVPHLLSCTGECGWLAEHLFYSYCISSWNQRSHKSQSGISWLLCRLGLQMWFGLHRSEVSAWDLTLELSSPRGWTAHRVSGSGVGCRHSAFPTGSCGKSCNILALSCSSSINPWKSDLELVFLGPSCLQRFCDPLKTL